MARRRGNNEGSIYRRIDGRWCAQISLGGHRLTKYAESQKECRDWIREMLDKVRGGLTFKATQITLDQYFQHWLSGKELSRRPKTLLQYKQIVTMHLSPGLGKYKLQDLRPDHITMLYTKKREEGTGARTVYLIHAVLNCALNQAVREGILGKNPVDAVERPRVEETEHQVLTEDQARQFIIASMNHRHAAIFHLAIMTGMREGELLGLKWADLDWSKGTIFVQRQVQRIPGKGLMLFPPKTKSGKRKIKLGHASLQSLAEHLKRQKLEKAAAGDEWQENDMIFPTTIGTLLDARNLYRDFKEFLTQAGLPDIRFHDLRHTSISLLLGEGVDLNTVQNRAGHSKASITSDIYGHAMANSQDRAANILDELLSPIAVKLQ